MIKLKKEKLESIYGLSEWVALFVVMHYCILRFFGSTSFGFRFPEVYANITFYSVVVVGILRLFAGAWLDIIHAENRRKLFLVLIKVGAAIAFIVPFFVVVYRFKYNDLIYLPFMAYCLYGAKPERVMKAYAICIGTMLAATVLSSLSGAIPNYVYLGKGRRGILRGSYGIVYPTDFAAYLVFFFLFAWGSGRFRNWRYTTLAVGVTLLMMYVIYTYPHGVNSTICCILIAVVIIYDGLSERVLPKHKGTKWITKVIDWLTIAAFPICGAAVYGLTWLYGTGNGLALRIDRLISSRLSMLWQAYEKYGLHWFGSLTPQKGGGLLYNDEYEFIDSSFGVILIRYGTILTVIFAIVWVWMTWKAVMTGKRRIALVMAVIAFHSMLEQRFTEINILLVMPLCCFALRDVAEKEKTENAKENGRIKKIVGWAVGLGTAGVFALFLPAILSEARIMTVLKEWSGSDEKTVNILLFWLVCFALLVMFGYFLYNLIVTYIEKKKLSVRSASGIGIAALSVVIGSVWINSCVSGNMYLYEAQIASDKPALDLILENAEEPVYAGQTEEIYKRSFNGISGRILSPEEMARSGRGSMLLEHDDEVFQLINTGARYAEISPYTGLYTYDDSVIEALRA